MVSNIKNIGKIIFKTISGIITAISIISIATIIALNSTFIYNMMISKYDLVKATGISKERLIENYKGLIKYLQNPFIERLHFQDFAMSNYGEVHFMEVKNIFITLIYISIIFALCIIIYMFFAKLLNEKKVFSKLINIFNLGSNILIGFFLTMVTLFIVDFSKAFVIFHKIFFKNDYWIFDAKIDPIINALPEQIFMIYGVIILGIIIVISIIIKILNNKYRLNR